MAMLYVLVVPAGDPGLTGASVVLPAGLKGLNNAGPHGLSEILYAFTSTPANNGSAFAGLTGSTYYYNTLFGFAMLIGRFAMHVPMLAARGVSRREAHRARVRREPSRSRPRCSSCC